MKTYFAILAFFASLACACPFFAFAQALNCAILADWRLAHKVEVVDIPMTDFFKYGVAFIHLPPELMPPYFNRRAGGSDAEKERTVSAGRFILRSLKSALPGFEIWSAQDLLPVVVGRSHSTEWGWHYDGPEVPLSQSEDGSAGLWLRVTIPQNPYQAPSTVIKLKGPEGERLIQGPPGTATVFTLHSTEHSPPISNAPGELAIFNFQTIRR